MAEISLDELDRAIISELEDDGRRAFREIARQLGISEATVRARVRRLEDAGAVRIVAFANPLKITDSVMALVLLSVDPAHQQEVVATLADCREVSYLSTTLGTCDISAQVVVRNQAELASFVRNQMRLLPGVIEAQTFIETEVHKLRFVKLERDGGADDGTTAVSLLPLRSAKRR